MTERTWGDDEQSADGDEPASPSADEQSAAEEDAAPSQADGATAADGEQPGGEDPTPNRAQRELIERTEGTFVVDAGAGTGKTFAVTRRYAEIVGQPGVEPEDVVLVTFTRSAATEMRERIVEQSSYSLRELSDASIQTFHSLCLDLLREHGARAPTHLGLDDWITDSTRVIEDELVERRQFEAFFDAFRDDHPEHADQFRALSSEADLLELVQKLAAKGVFPTADGWYRDGEDVLDGDEAAFRELFEAANRPRNGGSKQSELREALGRYGRYKTYAPDAPSKTEVRGEGTKRIPAEIGRRAFGADRSALKAFVHDVYHEYLSFALSRNYLTFGTLQLFAYVLLCEDAAIRDRVAAEYLLIDEFQDTSELQFRLALLLAGTENICAVGDWKQSIYSFQYADVENIRQFEDRIERFAAALNDDQERVAFDVGDVERIELTENYRSTQTILDRSEDALVAPGTSGQTVDPAVLDDVVSLSANAPFDATRIEGVSDPDECHAVLGAIQQIVGNEAYAVADEDGEPRPPTYGDVAVLTRTRQFGRELLSTAEEYAVPLAYDGGVELFRTDQAKLLLAWLRILESDADRGWAVVLEEAGYALDEIDHLLKAESFPADLPAVHEELAAFREELATLSGVGAVARRVFERYGFTGEYADVLLHTVQSLHDGSSLTRGDLVRHLERGIETGSTHEVATSAGTDSVTVQTIHAAKGLEYPIVVLANVNDGAFPPNGGGSGAVEYRDPVGLRRRKRYADVEAHPHVYDDWTHDVLRNCLPDDHDEERRLLYVAITRARQHVVFTAGEEPSAFFEALEFDERDAVTDVEHVERSGTEQRQLPFSIASPDGPVGHTPHTLMDDTAFEASGEDHRAEQEFRGTAFGTRVHDFAEAYALGEAVSPGTDADDERHVAAFLDGLSGDPHVEEPAALPVTVDGERVTIRGVADLVHETSDRVEVVDYKTDRSRRAEPEYRKQLSVYYHVLAACFPEKSVSASVFYTATGERREIEPLSLAEIEAIVRESS